MDSWQWKAPQVPAKASYRSRGWSEQDLGRNDLLQASKPGTGREDDSGVPGGVRVGLCAAACTLTRATSAGADGVFDVALGLRFRGAPLTISRLCLRVWSRESRKPEMAIRVRNGRSQGVPVLRVGCTGWRGFFRESSTASGARRRGSWLLSRGTGRSGASWLVGSASVVSAGR